MLNYNLFFFVWLILIVGQIGFAPFAQALESTNDNSLPVLKDNAKAPDSGKAEQEKPLKNQTMLLPAGSQSGLSLLAEGDLLQQAQKFNQAKDSYEKAVLFFQTHNQQPELALALTKLASTEKQLHNFNQSEKTYKRVLQILLTDETANQTNIGVIYSNLALVFQAQGKLKQAEKYEKTALAILKPLPKQEINYAQCLNDLSSIYRQGHDTNKAKQYFIQALKIFVEQLPANDNRLARCLDDLGTIYYEQGQYSQAEDLARKALAIFEKNQGPFGKDVAVTLNNLGYRLLRQNKDQESYRCFERSLSIQDKDQDLNATNLNLLANLHGLAELYIKQEQYVKLEAVLRQSLQIKEKNFGEKHPANLPDLKNLADCLYLLLQKQTEAQEYYGRIEEIEKNIPEKYLAHVKDIEKSELLKITVPVGLKEKENI